MHELLAAARDAYLHAFAGVMRTAYLVAACVVALAFARAWLIEDVPLRQK